MIYLDNAASTPILPEVKNKLLEVLDIYGNPSSIHSEGRKAKELIWDAKEIISKSLNCSEDELYFTSGATMSNNLILGGFQGDVICSAIEHDDILLRQQFEKKLPVDGDGNINIDVLKFCLENQTESTLYTIQAANSEIGTIQDIVKISKIIHSYSDAFLHVDATQYIPHFKIDVKKLGIDALSMSGQKIGCIKGIGLLYISDKLIDFIDPVIYGDQGLIGGTENVPGIVCLGEAFKHIGHDSETLYKMYSLRNQLIEGLDGELIGACVNRLPNNVCMCFKEVKAEQVVMTLNDQKICCSAGSACSSGNDAPSPTLLAIGLNREDAKSCVRFTLSEQTTKEEIEKTINITNKIVKMLRELG